MKLLVARHGQTAWNAVDRLCGRTDLELNELGIAQATALGEQLAREQAKVELIIASPLIRAQQTAALVARSVNAPLETDERLIEQNYGIYEGCSTKNPDFISNKRCFAFRYPQGESMMQVAHRVYGFLEELRLRRELQTVLLISHGGTCRLLHTYFEDMTNEAFYSWTMANAACNRYRLE